VLTSTRRLPSIALAGLLLGALAGPVGAATAPSPFDAAALTQAGTDLVTLTNRQRVSHGLIALQADPDLMSIARDRARVMATNDVMSHTEPNGQKVFDRLDDAGLAWSSAGEIIAWNTYPTEPLSVAEATRAWMNSPGHRSIMLSNGYNYVGYGAAISRSGKVYYAGVFVSERDETGAWVRPNRPTTRSIDSTHTRVYLTWTGADKRLQVRTAGLRDFEVQRRVAGGTWGSWGTRTSTRLSVTWLKGRTYEIRIRARDMAGNWGSWATVRVSI
jgi:uncharacterized protein YkwD